jgi:hypothetical protein
MEISSEAACHGQAVPGVGHLPVVQPDSKRIGPGAGNVQAFPVHAGKAVEPVVLGICDCKMGQVQLPGPPPGGAGDRLAGQCLAEKGELIPEMPARVRGQVAGIVPPFRAKGVVGTGIIGKLQGPGAGHPVKTLTALGIGQGRCDVDAVRIICSPTALENQDRKQTAETRAASISVSASAPARAPLRAPSPVFVLRK